MRIPAAVLALIVPLCAIPSGWTAAETGHLHVLRFADGQDATHLNTLLITTYPEAYPAELTAAYLTRLGSHGEPIPELAREVPSLRNGGVSGDGKTIVYHLRPNLRWSDGSTLTAADAVFTAKIIIGKDSPVASTAGWDKIVDVDSPHPGDVRFRLRTPYSPALTTFFNSFGAYSILPERLLRGKDIRRADFNRLPVGAGPFRYASYQPGTKIVMEANPFYRGRRPKLDRIEYVFLPDENTVTTQVLTGEIDMAIREQPTQLLRLKGSSAISFVETPSGNGGYIGFETAKPPFDDPRVRRALRDALDRKQILATVYHGFGSLSDDLVTPIDPFYGGGLPASPADLRAAASLLDSAGWRLGPDGLRYRNGQKLTVDFVDLTGNAIAATIVELARADWSKVGVSVATRTLSGDIVFAPGGVAARGDFGAMIYGEAITSDGLAAIDACSAIAPHGFDYERYCNPRVDALLAQADRSYDDTVRGRLYLEARRLIAADCPTIATIHREDAHALRSNVTGFHPNGLTLFDDVLDLDVKV